MEHTDIYTNCLSFQLTQARKKVFGWYDAYLKPLGLTPSFVYVLGVLRDVRSASPSKIATLLQLERPTVTTLLSRMELLGLIERSVNPKNRREFSVTLTDKGIAACDVAYPLLVEADKALNEVLKGNFQDLKDQIMQLNQALEEATNE